MNSSVLRRVSRARGIAFGVAAILIAMVAFAATRASGAVPSDTFIDLVPAAPSTTMLGGFDGPSQTILPNIASTLVENKGLDPKKGKLAGLTDVIPYLAKSWKATPTGYIFTLRAVKDQWGNTLSCADVAYSVARTLKHDFSSIVLYTEIGINFANPVTIISPTQCQINQSAVSAATLGNLTYAPLTIYDSTEMLSHQTSPTDYASSAAWLTAGHSATYAPYYISGFTSGQELDLTATPGWKIHPITFKHIRIIAVSNPQTRLQEVLTGQASHTLALDWTQFGTAAKAKTKVTTAVLPTDRQLTMQFNQKYAPLQNAGVRTALSEAINKVTLTKTVYGGYVKPALYMLPTTLQGLTFLMTPRVFNASKAKADLAAAGYPNGFPVTLSFCDLETGSQTDAVAALLQSQLAAIGVTVTLDPCASLTAFFAGERNDQMFIEDIGGTPAAAGPVISTIYNYNSRFSVGHTIGYDDSVLQSLIPHMFDVAGPAYNKNIRLAYFYIFKDAPLVPLVNQGIQSVSIPSVKGYNAYPVAYTGYEWLHH